MLLPSLLQAYSASPVVILGGGLLVLLLASTIVSSVREASKPVLGTRTPRRLKSTLPIFENTIDLLRCVSKLHDFTIDACAEMQCEPYLVRAFGAPDKTILSTPEMIEDVFKTHFDAFPKGPYQCDRLRDLLGDGIFAVDDVKWAQQRKTASRLFTMRALRESMTTTIQKHAVVLHRMFERAAQHGTELDLFKLFNRFTIEAFAEIGFGAHMNCLDSEEEHPFQRAFDHAQRVLVLRFVRPSWFWKTQRWLGWGVEGELKQDLDVINSTVLDIIHQSMTRRSNGGGGSNGVDGDDKTDIVSLFLDNYVSIAGDDSSNSSGSGDKQQFDPMFLRDIVVNFLIAGRDTTAQALSWFFYCLDRHPRVEAKLRAELRLELPELFDVSGGNTQPTMERVGRLVYLEAAIKETLRLYPSVPFSTKDANRDVVLSDGTGIRANTTVGLAFYAMGRMPHVWGPDAAEFKPERWIDPTSGKLVTVSAFKFVAFNAGPRTCLGMNLALLEMKLIIADMLSKFHVRLSRPEEVTYDPSITLPIKGALPATIERISAASSA